MKYHPLACSPAPVDPAWIVRSMFVPVPIAFPVASYVQVTTLGAFTAPSHVPLTVIDTTQEMVTDHVMLSSVVEVAVQLYPTVDMSLSLIAQVTAMLPVVYL